MRDVLAQDALMHCKRRQPSGGRRKEKPDLEIERG